MVRIAYYRAFVKEFGGAFDVYVDSLVSLFRHANLMNLGVYANNQHSHPQAANKLNLSSEFLRMTYEEISIRIILSSKREVNSRSLGYVKDPLGAVGKLIENYTNFHTSSR